MHCVGAAHDTLARSVNTAPCGFGVDSIVQFEPSQCSASVRLTFDLLYRPTAAHVPSSAQETAFRTLAAAPSGLGLDWIDHPLAGAATSAVAQPPEVPATRHHPIADIARAIR